MTGVALLLSTVLAEGTVQAQEKQPIGRWKFKHPEKTVKVVTIAGSIGAWPAGSFSQFLGNVCKNAEIVNRSKTGFGARALKHRFRQQVVRNRRVRLHDDRFEYWLMYAGGLNSIGTPDMTIKYQVETFLLAKRHGVRVLGLSLGPWGDEGDRRWRGFAGLKYAAKTKKVVDYVMGRLGRNEALGGYVAKEDRGLVQWKPGELPDLSVDIYDSPLRDKDAALRPMADLRRRYRRSWKLKRRFPDEAATVQRAAEIPQWYLKKEYRSFDHIHPNSEGHRQIAKRACAVVPANWSCDCARLDRLQWVRGQGIVPRASKTVDR
jgi:hypothetical protein